jgi:hypothetical protein
LVEAVWNKPKIEGLIPGVTGFFNLPNQFYRSITLRSIQLKIEKSARNRPGGEERQARKADNLTGICDPTL